MKKSNIYKISWNNLKLVIGSLPFSNFINYFVCTIVYRLLSLVIYEYSYLVTVIGGASTTQLLFPWILTVFELDAYDFCKVLESFVRDEPNLTKEAMKVSCWHESFRVLSLMCHWSLQRSSVQELYFSL